MSGLVVRIRSQGCGSGGGLWQQARWEDGKGVREQDFEERLLGMVCDVTAEWVAEERGEKDCCAAGHQRTERLCCWMGYVCGSADALGIIVREGHAWGCNQELSLQRGRVVTKRRA